MLLAIAVNIQEHCLIVIVGAVPRLSCPINCSPC